MWVSELQSLREQRAFHISFRADGVLGRNVQLDVPCDPAPCHFWPRLCAFTPKHLGSEPGARRLRRMWGSEVTLLPKDMKQPTLSCRCPHEAVLSQEERSSMSVHAQSHVLSLLPSHGRLHSISVVFNGAGFLPGVWCRLRRTSGHLLRGEKEVLIPCCWPTWTSRAWPEGWGVRGGVKSSPVCLRE